MYPDGLAGADLFRLMGRIKDPLKDWGPGNMITIAMIVGHNGTINETL